MQKASGENRIVTPANIVTIIRVLFVPVFFIYYLYDGFAINDTSFYIEAIHPLICALLFIVISATDAVDGYLARSRNEITNFGKFMDPLADKLLVIAAFLAFTEKGILPAWISLVVLFREFLVSGLRMLAASKGDVIAASWYGKAKTLTQMAAITLLLLEPFLSFYFSSFASVIHAFNCFVLAVSLILTVLSMIDYFVKGKHVFISNTKSNLRPVSFEIFSENTPDCDCPSYKSLDDIAQELIEKMKQNNLSLGTAESLTGGLIASVLTNVSGCSSVYKGSIVSYATELKERLLDVDKDRLDACGPVDEIVATEMAIGAKQQLNVSCSIAVTGIAGPTGAEADKPVGTVWIAISGPKEDLVQRFCFSGNRDEVRRKTAYTALSLLLKQFY